MAKGKDTKSASSISPTGEVEESGTPEDPALGTGAEEVVAPSWADFETSYGYDNPFLTFAKFVRERFNEYVLDHAIKFAVAEVPPPSDLEASSFSWYTDSMGDFDSEKLPSYRSNFPTITYEAKKSGEFTTEAGALAYPAIVRSKWTLGDLFLEEYNHWIRPATIGYVTNINSGFVAYTEQDLTRVNVAEEGYEYSDGEDTPALNVEGLRVAPVGYLYQPKVNLSLPAGPDGKPMCPFEDRGLIWYETGDGDFKEELAALGAVGSGWVGAVLGGAIGSLVGGSYSHSECDPFQDFKRLLISFRDNLRADYPVWWFGYYGDSSHWTRFPFAVKYPFIANRNFYEPGLAGKPDEAMGISAVPSYFWIGGPEAPTTNAVLDSKQLNGLIRSVYYLYLAIHSEESLADPIWTQYYLAEFLLAFTNMGSLEPHFNDYLCVPTTPSTDPFPDTGVSGVAAGEAFADLAKKWNRKSDIFNVINFVGAPALLSGDLVGSLDDLGLDAKAEDWPNFTRAEYNTPIFDYVNDLLAPVEEEHPGIVWSMLNYLNIQTPEDSEWTAGVSSSPPGASSAADENPVLKYDPVKNESYHVSPGQSHMKNSVKWSLEAWMSYFLSEPTAKLNDSLYESLLERYEGATDFLDFDDTLGAETWELDEEEGLYGIPGDAYDELLEEGLVLKPCDPPTEPFVPEECPPCIPNPEAFVPNWRENEDGVVFFNQRSCEYCVTTVSGETDATIVNDEVAREAFLNEEKERGIDLILQNFEKYPVNEETRNIIRDYSVVKEYDIPLRPLLPLRALVCVDVNVINAIELLSPLEEEIVPPPIEPIGVVLMAQEIRTMIKKANEAFRYYGHKYALWSHETGLTIPNFDPDEERRKLRTFVPVLVTLMGRNGFKLNGKGAAEKIEFRFNSNYELTYAEANEPNCPPVELIWKKGDDNLGGFKSFESTSDPRTMAYISKLPDIVNDAAARDPKEWDEFFTKYTYPEINTNEVVDPIGDPVMADGPLQQAAQKIVNDIVGLEDAIVAKFGQQVCRDREGKEILDADIRDFDEMLRRALHAKAKNINIGDDTFINLGELLGESSNMDELWHKFLNKLGECGWLDLLSTAFACMSKGMDLEVSLGIIIKAALKGMDPGNLEKIFIGLPPDKQLEIKKKIAEAGWGNIPAPWDSGYRPGNYAYDVETDEDGNPIPETHTVANPDYGVVDGAEPYTTIDAENDERDMAERTAIFRREASPSFDSRTTASWGGAGSVGTAAGKTVDAIIDVYAEAILDSVDADYLLKELGKFPGGELVTKILKNPACPLPPLFSPPLNEFMKTLDLPFCRKSKPLVWPKWKGIRIPDFMRMLMEALVQAVMELAIKIIITILELIVKLLLSGLCGLLGILGDLVTGLFENQPSNQFADAIKNAVSDTALNDMGGEALADDDTINQAAADLFAAFSRSCTNPEDLPNAGEAEAFLRDVGIMLTQGEFIDLLRGNATTEVTGAVHQLVLIVHKKFLCVMPSASEVSGFFESLAAMLDRDFLASLAQDPTPDIPVFPSVCSGVSGAEEVNNLRRSLMLRKGVDESLVEEQLENLRCRATTDLEQLADIIHNGAFGDFPPLMDDYSDPSCPIRGFMPRDPDPELVPGSPTDALIGSQGVFSGMFDILEKVYYDDLMGRGGFINMVLSDRDGRSLRAHHMFVAAQSLFGIFGGRSNTHQMLLPETVGRYLEYTLKNPTQQMNDGYEDCAFLSKGNGFPNLKMQYCNYYPWKHSDSYYFDITGKVYNTEADTLDNSYDLTLTETFKEDYLTKTEKEELGIEEDDSEKSLTIETSFSGNPDLPSGVQDFIELELGLDIEGALARLREEGATNVSAQSAVFGEYVKKIIEENIDPGYVGKEHTEAKLNEVAFNCATDIHNYVSDQYLKRIVQVISEDNQAFVYGEGGSDFDRNEPITYPPKKIDLDVGHLHPVTGEPVPLDPLAWGGNEKFPAYYEQPPQNRPGWCGIADQLIPEVDGCEPARKNVVRYDDILDKVSNEFYTKIADDDRAGGAACLIEEPCNKILSREASAMIEGNLRATIRVYAVEAFLKGAPSFTKFKADFGELYGDPLKTYITSTLKEGFVRYSKKGFLSRRSEEYYYQFLEQAVQNFGKKIDAGLAEPTQEEQEAIDVINSLQGIWTQDTIPTSGKVYADTGERLKRVLSPGYFGAVVRNIFTDKSLDVVESDKAILNARKAKELKEESWNSFMKEIEPLAEIILKRYIEEELKYISDEFAERIPPRYRTLYELVLGKTRFGMFGIIPFMMDGTILPSLSPEMETPFQVADDAVNFTAHADDDDPSIITPAPQNTFLKLAAEASRITAEDMRLPALADPLLLSANPFSRFFGQEGIEEKGVRYSPFALETYIYIEDFTAEDWTSKLLEAEVFSSFEDDPSATPDAAAGAEISEVFEFWQSTIMTRPSHLFGVVKASEWKDYLDSNRSRFEGYLRSDLWAQWSYGLRMVFVPPGESENGITPENWLYPPESIKKSILEIYSEDPDVSSGIDTAFLPDLHGKPPFTETTVQNNKAFSFGLSDKLRQAIGDGYTEDANFDNPLRGYTDPMNIPLASATLPIDMTVTADDAIHNWITSDGYDDAGGFLELVQRLVCGPEYQMLFRYCFNLPRLLSTVAIYMIQAFVPSIGRADPNGADSPGLFAANATDIDTDVPGTGFDHDGWYKPSSILVDDAKKYHGGGLGLSPFALNFKRWDHINSFSRSKKALSRTFMDLYNSNDPSYDSDSFPSDDEMDGREGLKVTWPKFMFRLRQKKVDRPYDKNGDICD